MQFKQKAILKSSTSNVFGSYFLVDAKIVCHFKKNKVKRVVCKINDVIEIQCAILSFGEKGKGILMNKELCKKLNLKIGSSFNVVICKDESEYGIFVSEEVKEVLLQDLEGSELFHKLTIGKQRSLLYLAEKPKNTNLKIRNAINILNFLKDYNGVLDFKMLNEYMKNHK